MGSCFRWFLIGDLLDLITGLFRISKQWATLVYNNLFKKDCSIKRRNVNPAEWHLHYSFQSIGKLFHIEKACIQQVIYDNEINIYVNEGFYYLD